MNNHIIILLCYNQFMLEKDLVSDFINIVQYKNPWGLISFNTEFNYNGGRTDLIGTNENNDVIAIEAKLIKWKTAIQQAYRNTCFANKSYVLLPKSVSDKICKYDQYFHNRGIGLCCLENNQIKIIIEAQEENPIMPSISKKALSYIEKGKKI